MTIYTPIPPTYLYIKQHSVTGLKYFGKTTRKDPYTYNGSGKHWKNHIKKHGKEHIVTLWVSQLYYDTSISDYALQFSIENNIIEYSEWANLILENGLGGGNLGKKQSAESNSKRSVAMTGKPKSAETRAKLSIPCSDEKKSKISIANTGSKRTPEERLKMSLAAMGRIPWNKGLSYSTGKPSPLKGLKSSNWNENSRPLPFLSIIETRKTHTKTIISRKYPELKQFY